MLQLTTFPNIAIAGAVRGHVQTLKDVTQNTPDTCMTVAVNALPIEQLRKLQDGLASNREDGRLKHLAKELFLADFTNIASGQRVLKICEDSIYTMTTIVFYTEFMNDDGSLAWDRFRKMVNKAVEDNVEARANAI